MELQIIKIILASQKETENKGNLLAHTVNCILYNIILG